MTHALKTLPIYFKAIESGEKNFEVRQFDRPFRVGERLLLQEFDEKKGYTGKEVDRRITYILYGGQFGIDSNYVVMGLEGIIQ